MNDSAYINVYHTINPSKFYSYGTYISKVCFGLAPGTTDEYSFISNPVTGHFIYKVSSKYLMPSSNPQNESEARNCLAEILSNLRDKISAAKNSKSLPEDFPVLFNNSHISTMNIAPVYDGQNTNIITSWKAVLGIELKVFNSLKSAKSMLESDSIIIEFSGKRIIEMDYNYTPIVKREEVPIRPNENSEFILKKVNANTIAPYYLTADGYIPACSKSVPVLQKPVSFGWSSPQPTHDSSKSMLTLSDIVEPTEDHPGSAKLVISMDYKVVTTGEGAVDMNLINPEEFNRLFKLGNFPGEKKTGHLLLKRLPTKNKEAECLSYFETINIGSTFSSKDYYEVQVEYDYKLNVEHNCNLYLAMKWMVKSINSRGIVLTTPLLEDAESLADILLMVESDLGDNKELSLKENDKKIGIKAKLILLILENIIADDIDKYRNSNIFIDDYERIYEFIINDISFNRLLKSINSNVYISKKENVNDKKWIEIEGINKELYKYTNFLFDLIHRNADIFKQCDDSNRHKYAISKNGDPNFIILNPRFFATKRKDNLTERDLSTSEILVHEAGHNSAEKFSHSERNYKYYQTGLQSNGKGRVFPTEKNTIGIINDAENRQNMRIMK
ncbi:MAG: hypothetical protein IKJ56_01935 [Bacteroidales bacterium]|nr:hypothetical protein [Bacteroidales bacterium]